MLFVDFLRWWYGPGWAMRVRMLVEHLKNMSNYFSIGTLLRTMFSPWRQIITTARPDQSINDKMSALVDNIVSRMVGFVVRVFVLAAATITLIVVTGLNIIYVVIWPILPLSGAIIISVGVMS